jgi:PAS domain S-box-containing protein
MNGSDEIREQPLDELAELHRRVAELEAAATGKKRAEQIQTVLFDIARATAESRDLEELLKTIHERLGTLIDTTNFFVALYDEENDIYTFPYWVDAVDTDFGPQSLKGSLTEVVRKTGKPLLIDRDRHRQLVQEGEVAVVGPASYVWLGAPLKTAQKVIGVIAVQSYTEKSLYTTSDLELLSYVSENIAWAIERKQMAEALLEREERLRALVGNLTEGITVIDADGNEIDNIPTLGPDTGYTPGERLGTSIFERVHPDDLPHVQESLARVLEQPEESVLAEVRVCHKDGSWRVFEAAASNRLDNPAIRGIVVTTRDITEQKRAEQIQTVLFDIARATGESRDVEELLKIIDERLGTLIDTSNFFVALYDEQSDLYSFPYWVDAQDNDFSPQSLKGSCTDYVRRMGVPLLVDEDMDRYLVQKGEVELVGPPSRIWLGAPLKTGQKVIGVVVVQSYTEKSLYTAPDLALLSYVSEHIAWAIERKWAEEKLRESEHKYRSLTEQSLQGIVVGQGVPPRLVFANAAIAGILGYTVEELKSLSPEEITALVHPEDRATFFQRYRTRLEGEPTPPRYQLRGIRKDGTVCWLEMLSQRIEYEGSPAVQAAFMDITDRKRAEEALNRRDAILEAVNSVAESFLQTSDWRQVIGSVLERLGKATGVDRAAIFEKQPDQEAPILASLSYEWVAEGIPPYADDPRFRSIDVVQAGYSPGRTPSAKDVGVAVCCKCAYLCPGKTVGHYHPQHGHHRARVGSGGNRGAPDCGKHAWDGH